MLIIANITVGACRRTRILPCGRCAKAKDESVFSQSPLMLLIDARCADVIRHRSRLAVHLADPELSVVRHGVLYGLKYFESASFTMATSYGFLKGT